jgi:hypothetical protein
MKCGVEADWNTADCPICFGQLESISPSDATACSASSVDIVEMLEWMKTKWVQYASCNGITLEVSLLRSYRVCEGKNITIRTGDGFEAVEWFNTLVKQNDQGMP